MQRCDAGVVDEDVEAPELRDDRVDGGLDRVPLADVQRERACTMPPVSSVIGGRGLLAGVLLAARHDDRRRPRGQAAGDRAAEPAGGAGDERDLAVELARAHVPPPYCRFSSSRAIVRRCTSVGPSAICSARVIANSRASTVSSLTPAAP